MPDENKLYLCLVWKEFKKALISVDLNDDDIVFNRTAIGVKYWNKRVYPKLHGRHGTTIGDPWAGNTSVSRRGRVYSES